MKKPMKKVYDNVGYLFLLFIPLTLIGFFKSYFGIFPRFEASINNATVIHFHAIVTGIWVILLIIQPLLIRYQKNIIHKILGKFSYFLVPLIVISFLALIYTKYQEAGMEKWPTTDVLNYFYFQILHTVFFITFYVFAILYKYKGKIALHGAYMVSTGLIFINPIVRRVFFNAAGFSFTISETIALLLTDISLITLLFLSKKYGLPYKVYYYVMMLFAIYQVPMVALMYVYRAGG